MPYAPKASDVPKFMEQSGVPLETSAGSLTPESVSALGNLISGRLSTWGKEGELPIREDLYRIGGLKGKYASAGKAPLAPMDTSTPSYTPGKFSYSLGAEEPGLMSQLTDLASNIAVGKKIYEVGSEALKYLKAAPLAGAAGTQTMGQALAGAKTLAPTSSFESFASSAGPAMYSPYAPAVSPLYSAELAAGGLTEGSVLGAGAEAQIAPLTAAPGAIPAAAYIPPALIGAMVLGDLTGLWKRGDEYQYAPGEESFYSALQKAEQTGDFDALAALLNANRSTWGATGFKSINPRTQGQSWFDRYQSRFTTPTASISGGPNPVQMVTNPMFSETPSESDYLQMLSGDRAVKSSSIRDYLAGGPISFTYDTELGKALSEREAEAESAYTKAISNYYGTRG